MQRIDESGQSGDETRSRDARRLLDELTRAERISTMAEMATGLAHELNQPLAAIVAYVDACQELVESGRMKSAQLTEVLQSVSNQAERAGQIIHRLRKMIKRPQPVRSSVDVNDAVRAVAAVLEAEARDADVRVLLELDRDLPWVTVDEIQIRQVLLQLARNGFEAMIETGAGERTLSLATCLTSAAEVEVAVCDTGHGLAGDAAARAFEPFFTTKSEGLGLGLSISRTIVDAHGGQIWITPNAARGATARFTLPASKGNAPHAAQADGLHR